ncbi:MAG: hypothetical protein IT445_12090 [Phycisphaeraceae bacterium]|nr:hypothetical protein [Phycisphaeraceae bacterium]
MALLEQTMRQPTAADGAFRIRHLMRQSVMQIEHSLQNVNRIVQQHGRNAINQALGNDAQQLSTIYASLKACLEDIDPSRQVPDLPA